MCRWMLAAAWLVPPLVLAATAFAGAAELAESVEASEQGTPRGAASSPAPAPWRITEAGFDPRQTPRLAVSADGTAYVAFNDPSGRLLARRPDTTPSILSEPPLSATGVVLESFGDRFHAAWVETRRAAPPAVVLSSLDGAGAWTEPRPLDTSSRPLPRIHLTGDAGGQLAVVWLGDAPDPPAETAGDAPVDGPVDGLIDNGGDAETNEAQAESRPIAQTSGAASSGVEAGPAPPDRPPPGSVQIAPGAADADVGSAHQAVAAATPSGPPASTSSDRPDGPNYHLYGRRSTDGGASWGEVARLTRGFERGFWPAVTMAGGRPHVFADALLDDTTHVVHLAGDAGTGWTPAEPIKAVGSVLLIAAATVGDAPMVVWFGSEGDRFRLESAVRDGSGWRTHVFPGSEAYDIGAMDLVAQGERVLLVFSARSALQTAQPRKNHVYVSTSRDGGASWGPIRPLRHHAFDTTQANFPHAAPAADGDLVVAWNDYRNIRGDLYVNRSPDGGETWLEEDLALDEPGAAEEILFPFARHLRAGGERLYLLSARYRDEGLAVADLYLHAVKDELAGADSARPGGADSPASREALEARVTAFWDALVAGDHGAAYDLYDPYFRHRMRRDLFIAQAGRVRHESFKLEDLRLEGRVARVRVSFVYEIPTLKMPRGGTIARPPTRTEVAETWIFIDGQWHKEYHNAIGDFAFTRY